MFPSVFENQGINPVGDHASRLVPTQINKNLATNAIKGLSIPSRPLTKVRSNRDSNIFLVFYKIDAKSKDANKDRLKANMIRDRPGGHRFH